MAKTPLTVTVKVDPETVFTDDNVYQQELGMLITDLRAFITRIHAGDYLDLDQSDLAYMLEEIIDG